MRNHERTRRGHFAIRKKSLSRRLTGSDTQVASPVVQRRFVPAQSRDDGGIIRRFVETGRLPRHPEVLDLLVLVSKRDLPDAIEGEIREMRSVGRRGGGDDVGIAAGQDD